MTLMTPSIPQYHELMWPALRALKELGGSATVREMYEHVVENEGFTEAQQAVPTKDGRMSEIEYRLHWARTHLKGVGAIENSTRGVWAIMEKGQTLTEAQMHEDTKAWRTRSRRKDKKAAPIPADDDRPGEEDWKGALVARLRDISASGFERLSQRLLREAGFINVDVTGKSGDGGIDGVGVYRLSLVSFPVYFQCKRHKATVGPEVVRDFRGAMVGRGEKGLLITTASFTKSATAEANRDGAPPVELIDGDRLCGLLREFRLGVSVTQRVEEDVTVVNSFFDEYD
jgi:restriction system protein